MLFCLLTSKEKRELTVYMPFSTLAILPTQKQEWGAVKGLRLEKISTDEKVLEAVVYAYSSSFVLDTASLDNQKIHRLRQMLHRSVPR